MAVRTAYSRRYAPYPGVDTGRGAAYVGTRVFVANLNYQTTWQALKDHCRTVGDVKHVDLLPGKDGRPGGMGLVEFTLPEYAAAAIRELNDTVLDGRVIAVREDREEGNRGGGPVRSRAPLMTQHAAPRRGGEDEPMDPASYAKWYREYQERKLLVGTAAYRSRFDRDRSPPPVSRAPPRAHNNPPAYQPREPRVQPGVPGTKVFFGNLAFSVNWRVLKDFLRESGFENVHVTVAENPDGRSKGHGLVTFDNPEDAERAVETFHDHVFEGRPMDVHLDKFA